MKHRGGRSSDAQRTVVPGNQVYNKKIVRNNPIEWPIKEVLGFCLNYVDFFQKGIFARELYLRHVVYSSANEDYKVRNASAID